MKQPVPVISKKFRSKTLLLDGKHFDSCQFYNCNFEFSGGTPPILTGCSFENCTWKFSKQAANTLGFLSGSYVGGFDDLVEKTFHEIRKGKFLEIPVSDQAATEDTFGTLNLHPLTKRIPKIVQLRKNKP